MKFRFTYSVFGLLFLAFLFMNSSLGRAKSTNWGSTGAPGDQMMNGMAVTCAFSSCHGAGTSTTIESQPIFDLKDPAGNSINEVGYIPGTIYEANLTVEVTSGSAEAFAFQILALNAAKDVNGDEVSDWEAISSNVQIDLASNTGRTYAEHKGPSVGNNQFEMTWTAPENLDGDVTFYICSNASNNDGGPDGDSPVCSTLTINKNTSTSNDDFNKNSLQFNAFPNPTNDLLTLDISVAKTDIYTMRLFNNLGQMVQSERWNLITGENRETINLNNSAPGVYIVQLVSGSETISQNIVKL